MPHIRRSLTISEENDVGVQRVRSLCLSLTPPVDIDYTTMTNIFLNLGSQFFIKDNWKDNKFCSNIGNLMISAITKYAFDASFKSDTAYDQIFDQLMKNLPEVMERYVKKQLPESNKYKVAIASGEKG